MAQSVCIKMHCCRFQLGIVCMQLGRTAPEAGCRQISGRRRNAVENELLHQQARMIKFFQRLLAQVCSQSRVAP